MENGSKNKKTLTGLAARLGRLPSDKKRAALETSAALAGVSLRVSRKFVEAVPRAAKLLSADDLRLWGEVGRRLAMGSADVGAAFFADGVAGLKPVPENSRAAVFQICTRQLVLSSSIALETFRAVPEIAREVDDEQLLAEIFAVAFEIAQRSAKHSAEFLQHTPAVAAAIRANGDNGEVAAAAIALARQFAERTGGMTADLWSGLPDTLAKVSSDNAVKLLHCAGQFLEFGGSVTLHFVSSGGDVLGACESAFDDWTLVARTVARHGNAVLIAFLRTTPKVIAALTRNKREDHSQAVGRVLQLTAKIAETDAESALAAFKSSAAALRTVSLEQFEEWVETGIKERSGDSSKARRSYFALETRESNSRLQRARLGLPLEKVQSVLRMYVEALTGKEVEVAPITEIPQESRIGDGKTIYLPSAVAEFEDDEMDFRLYKVLAAHGAGQIEFGTFEKDTDGLKAAFTELSELYEATADQTDAFSLAGYIEDVQKGERALSNDEIAAEKRRKKKKLPKGSDYRDVLTTFPEPRLARKIFGTMENARIDGRLRGVYRGLRKDLDLMQKFLRENRPYIFDLPMHQVPFELLFQITMCGGATDDARKFYGQVVSEIEAIIEKYVAFDRRGDRVTTVADSIMATSRIYTLFQTVTPEQNQDAESEQTDDNSEFAYDDKDAAEAVTEDQVKREKPKEAKDVSDLFNAWNSLDDEGEPDELQGSEAWSQSEMPEQALESDDVAFAYDEWDRELNDYRVGWSRVIEKRVKQGDRTFVELARSRYRGVIASIRHQFQLMKPENLTRVNREIDGEDYDLNALVEFVVDRRADGRQSENIYTKKLRRQRDVAVSLLLDQSSSTARTITRNPLQPYTHPGRRIIEIEKEGLVLMSEALEAVGDVYSIAGFTSEGRRNVKFYVVKDFDEKYSEEIERRIGGITFQNNTRLGAAIRHAAHKLLRQESRTKLLIILTDGRPYDHDYGDARYAREDVREALTEAKMSGITPFCITVDRESEAELRDLYGDVGYTIIDDVLSLPERMPNIYRRLTS
ncbi:MAG TPA: VWA domain-containing protein [Pyrinomonadaceae bacterium]|nr:VWA domain-containing protein [Chloracidobacterium sp.]MBP9107981.1 VWA domain-containing protein [Pyrinomonadaceae bacterium]MBK7801705.1 VWA domain-containing protein [Chloracidobacterium sp.]MBK9437021.1 VWA domain-containing protein [Chloracidobacterium sp.]MBL0242014.1 VWA domain-containing protein [Chloracidobacterium sp.]